MYKVIPSFYSHISKFQYLSQNGLYIGVGTVDGDAKIINCRYTEIQCESRCHDLITKSVAFPPDLKFLASASPDYSYNFLPNVKSQGIANRLK